MKSILAIMAIVLVCVSCTAGTAVALDSTTWTGASHSTNWFDSRNWNEGGVPTSSKEAIIPYSPSGGSYWPVINDDENPAYAGKLTITVNGGTRGKLTLDTASTLILGDGNPQTSSVDGDIKVGDQLPVAFIKINGVHTITGRGGKIELTHKGTISPYNGSNDKLIITGYATDRPNSLTIFGNGTVAVPFDNRAYVVGTAEQELHLTTYDMTGTSAGYWLAEGLGKLWVLTDVSGACTWLIDSPTAGYIHIGDDSSGVGCVAATGPVTLMNGSLTVHDGSRFCTQGKLTWKSVTVGGNPTIPQILTSGDATATFGLGMASTCSACNSN